METVKAGIVQEDKSLYAGVEPYAVNGGLGQPYRYLISKSGSYNEALNGRTGLVDFSDLSLAEVIEACAIGGRIYLDGYDFLLDRKITISNPYVWLDADINSSIIPINRIDNHLIYGANTATKLRLSNLRILGNKANQTAGDAVFLNGIYEPTIENLDVKQAYANAIEVNNCVKAKIVGNTTMLNGGDGVLVTGGSVDAKILHHTSELDGYVGIYSTGWSTGTITSDCHVTSSQNWGIDYYQSPDGLISNNKVKQTSGGRDHNDCIVMKDSDDTIIDNNRCSDAGDTGIAVITCKRAKVTNNRISKAWYNGVYLMGASYCEVSDNIISDCSQKIAGTWSAISLEIEPYVPSSATNNVIKNNYCIEDQVSPTMKHGVTEDITADYNEIIDNTFDTRLIGVTGVYPAWTVGYTKGVYQNGLHSIVKDNRGHVTENIGTAVVPSGSLWVDVPHGCDYVPNAGDIHLHLTAPTTNDIIDKFVMYLDSLKFSIGIKYDAGVGGANFAWSIDRE
jgi:parallel beta-helix repeat protein